MVGLIEVVNAHVGQYQAKSNLGLAHGRCLNLALFIRLLMFRPQAQVSMTFLLLLLLLLAPPASCSFSFLFFSSFANRSLYGLNQAFLASPIFNIPRYYSGEINNQTAKQIQLSVCDK